MERDANRCTATHHATVSRNLNIWLLFTISKSTAIVVPILPIYFMEQGGYSVQYMLGVASLYILVPVLLDIPFGALADRIGQRQILLLGSGLFLASFLAVLSNTPLSYHLYMLTTGLAAACYSGSETLCLRGLLTSDLSLSRTLAQINEKFYVITAILLVLAGALYTVAPPLPLVIQCGMLLLAIAALLALPNNRSELHQHAKTPCQRHTPGASNALWLLLTATLVVGYSGLFAGLVQLNSRTVQIQFTEASGWNGYILVGVIFAVGNLASAAGARLASAFWLDVSDETKLHISAYLAAIAAWFLSNDSTGFLTIGFLTLCVFKGFFRPPLAACMSRLAQRGRRHATAYAVLNVASAAIAAAIHFVAAESFTEFQPLYLGMTLGLAIYSSVSWVLFTFSRDRGVH